MSGINENSFLMLLYRDLEKKKIRLNNIDTELSARYGDNKEQHKQALVKLLNMAVEKNNYVIREFLSKKLYENSYAGYVKKIGHIFGLRDDDLTDKHLFPTINYLEKEGVFDRESLLWLKSGLTDYLQHLVQSSSFTQKTQVEHAVKGMLDALTYVDVVDGKVIINVDNIAARIQSKLPVIIPVITGSSSDEGHSITIAVLNDLNGDSHLVVSNRGYGRLIKNGKGIGLYSLKLNNELLRNKQKLSAKINQLLIPHVFRSMEEIINSMAAEKATPFFDGHVFSDQKTGNCGFANKKPLFYAFLWFSGMTKTGEALREYKKYTTFLRQSEITNLIKDALGPEKATIAKELLLAILIKLTNKIYNKLKTNPKSFSMERDLYILYMLVWVSIH